MEQACFCPWFWLPHLLPSPEPTHTPFEIKFPRIILPNGKRKCSRFIFHMNESLRRLTYFSAENDYLSICILAAILVVIIQGISNNSITSF